MWEQKIKKIKLRQNSICIQSQNLKLWQNSKTKIVTTLKLWQISIYEGKKLKGILVGKTGHLDKQWHVLWAAFCDLTIFLGVIKMCWLLYRPLNHCHGLIHMVLLIQRCAWYYKKFHEIWLIEKAIFFSTK